MKTTMNDGRVLEVTEEKAFQLRRAGLAPADPAADAKYIDGLVILELNPVQPRRGHSAWLSPRPLERAERDLVMRGRSFPSPTQVVPRAEASVATAGRR